MKVKSIAVIISLSLMLILTACSSDYTRTIEKNWGVSLPKANEELYSVDSGPSIFGKVKGIIFWVMKKSN